MKTALNKVFGAIKQFPWAVVSAFWYIVYAFAIAIKFVHGRKSSKQKNLTSHHLLLKNIDETALAILAKTEIKYTSTADGILIESRQKKKTLKALKLCEVVTIPHSESLSELIARSQTDRTALDRLEIIDAEELTVLGKIQGLYPDRLHPTHPFFVAPRQIAIAKIIAERLKSFHPGSIVVQFENRYSDDYHTEVDTMHVHVVGHAVTRNYSSTTELCGIMVKGAEGIRTGKDGVILLDEENYRPIGRYDGRHLYIYAGLHSTCDDNLCLRLFDLMVCQMRKQMDWEGMVESTAKIMLDQDKDRPTTCTKSGAPTSVKIVRSGFSKLGANLVAGLVDLMLTEVIEKPIVVTNGARVAQTNASDGKFHIFYDAYRIYDETVKPPSRLWGWPLAEKEQSYLPIGSGRLICDESGFPVAELDGDNLFIFIDMVSSCSRLDCLLFARFLLEVRLTIKAMRENGGLTRRDSQAFLEHSLCLIEKAKTLKAVGTKADTATRLTKDLQYARLVERSYFSLYDAPEAALGIEFDRMFEIEKVLALTIDAGKAMKVTTDVLYCVNPDTGNTHEIGAFEITFPFDPNEEIVWLNLTRRVDAQSRGFNAPHVNGQGHGCLGNQKNLLQYLRSTRDFATLLEVSIHFIESVDTNDSWGSYIKRWPVIY